MTKGPKSDDQPAAFLHWPIQGFNARKVLFAEFFPHRMGAQGDGHRPVFTELPREVVLESPHRRAGATAHHRQNHRELDEPSPGRKTNFSPPSEMTLPRLATRVLAAVPDGAVKGTRRLVP